MLCHLHTLFHLFRKQLQTRHSFSGCSVPQYLGKFFVRAATQKKRGLLCVTFTSPSTPVNPSLIQLAACAARHGTLTRVAGVQGKISWLWMVLYSEPASWTWWQVFCSPPCPPLSDPWSPGGTQTCWIQHCSELLQAGGTPRHPFLFLFPQNTSKA